MLKQFVCAVLFAIMFTSCAYNTTNIEPPQEPYYRVIPAEPEENAENHLYIQTRNEKNEVIPSDSPLHLQSAIYSEDYSVEYYVSLTYDRPIWDTLLVRTNGKIYPLFSCAPNVLIHSLITSQDIENESCTLWAITGESSLSFFKYTYDPAQDAYIETKICDDESGYSYLVGRADLNHSLEDIADGKVVFGSTMTTLS
jgi:hypothetical protein